MDRRSQTVLVTGANSGIGLETLLHVARLGFRAVGSVRSDAKADSVAAAAAEAGLTVGTVLLDVTDADRCADVIERVRPWGLVNNAGYSGTGAVEDVPDEEVRNQLEAMVVAPLRLARLAIPAMRAAGDGRIVNVSSIYGRTTTPLTGWYQASKHALEAVSDALRMEVASAGIKVVLVEPGGFKTGIWEDNQQDVARRGDTRYRGAYERTLQLMRLSQPVMGDPAQCARVIVRALRSRSPRARYLVGYDAQTIALVSPLTPTAVKDRLTRFTLGL
jgi:NAD(P)-dependent dehydrogenase (short-subunit alcohol dehydrogenase family)